jgi:hypothetical protein
MTSRQLEQTFKVTFFSTLGLIMDLVRLVKSLFIPTPAIWTIILGKKLQEEGLATYAEQDDFKIDYAPNKKV